MITPPRAAIYGLGALGIAGFVFKMLAVEYPDGDPDRARQAGDVWARLAERIDKSPHNTYPSAAAVWKRNAGEGVAAFRTTVTAGLYPEPPALGFAEQLAHRCRQNSAACDEFAEVIRVATHAYRTLALANFASFMFITTFPWQASAAYEITQFLIRRAEAGLLKKLLEHSMAKILLSKLTEYSLGSASFALGDVGVVSLVKGLRGEDIGSPGEIGTQILKEFAASVAFYGAFDAAMPAARAMTKNLDLQYFIGRMVGGSIGYGPAYDAMSGETGTDLIPTWKQTLSRVLLYFTMAHKAAG